MRTRSENIKSIAPARPPTRRKKSSKKVSKDAEPNKTTTPLAVKNSNAECAACSNKDYSPTPLHVGSIRQNCFEKPDACSMEKAENQPVNIDCIKLYNINEPSNAMELLSPIVGAIKYVKTENDIDIVKMSPSKFKNINVVEPSEEHVLGTLDPVSGSSALNVSSAGSPSRIEYYKNENIYSSLSPTSQHSEPPFLYNIKFYRFMICEWFYSYIDQPLFTKENNNFEFLALLKTYFPLLYTRSLNGIEWNYIRKRLQRVVPVRRTSSAFFLQERIRLERCREKMRFLMENQLIDYLDDDLPVVIPRPLDVGSLVRATLFEPQYGSYVGTVISIEQHGRLYRVRFTIDSFQNEVELPDFRLALEQIPLQTETAEVVTVPVKHIRQIALLQQTVHEKNQLLDEMENIRLNAVGRRAMGVCMMERDQEQSQLYIELIKKLIQLNRTLLQVVKLIAFDYQQFMFEPLATDSEENNLIVENQVEEIAEQLLDGYVLVKEASANPTAKLLWSTTMQHLYGRPDLLKQLEKYLASQIGTVFNPTMPSSS